MFKVAVIMSTYNGEKYITEQLDSILSQENVLVDLYIRDDGSTDNTYNILEKYSTENCNHIFITHGNNMGFARSFWSELLSVNSEYDFYAFSDQDDVWKINKLFQACSKLKEQHNKNAFLLYSSAMDVVDENLNHMYYQSFNKLRISFGSALSRQRIAGCTMVFNKDLFNIIKSIDVEKFDFTLFTHDMLVYYICLLIGGQVLFDDFYSIYFRRRSESLTLQGKSKLRKIKSILSIFSSDKNIRFRKACSIKDILDDLVELEQKKDLDKIINYRNSLSNTFSLAFGKTIKCGLWSVDFINSLAVIFRKY